MALLRLVYDDLIQQKLDEFVNYWNTHPIRKQHVAVDSPNGVPDTLFFNPESYQHPQTGARGQAFGVPVDAVDLQACIEFVYKYEADRGGQAAPTRGDPSRITRGDLTLPMVPIFREILSTLATPTMSNARSVYQVALWLYRKRTEGGEPEAA